MNESLLHLYELQKIDTKLDELIENRGELPERVDETRNEVGSHREELERLRATITELETRGRSLSAESLELRDKVEQYKAQQFDVKTTREYDAITFQLEDANKRLNRSLEESGRTGIALEQARSEEGLLSEKVEHMEKELVDSEATLKAVLAETQDEEKHLQNDRKKMLKLITAPHLSMYNRVRPAKNGIAVVPIRNGVCGGCFNAIPRQMVLELKLGEKHTVCEYCGRIVVGEPISLLVDGPPVAAVQVTAEEE